MRDPSRRRALGAALALLACSANADASEPALRIIVPFAAGGASDVAARAIGDALGRSLGLTVVVENKAGATGLIGTAAAARAPADGSTLLLGHNDPMVIGPFTRKAPYDPIAFEPVAFVSKVRGALLARAGSGIDSGLALIKAAKERPGQISFASWGQGSSVHLGMELMEQIAGIQFLHVPFPSTVASIQALLAQQVDLAWATPEFALQLASKGKALIVGASSAGRIERAPGIPSLAEQGFPGLDLDNWYGFFAPPATPLAVIERLHAAINAALVDPQTAEELRQGGHEVKPMSIKEFDGFVQADRKRWRDLIQTRKLTFEGR